jgi:thioredoxin-related protein
MQKLSFMKLVVMLLLAGISFSFTEWQTDFETAKKVAREKDRYILLNFSGSDWCAPCIRLRKEVFDSDDFSKLADNSLVLFNADFPRNKKNQLPKEIQKRNEGLADLYNPSGKFPFTLLLTPEGKVVKSWEGFPNNNGHLFIEQINSVCDARRY